VQSSLQPFATLRRTSDGNLWGTVCPEVLPGTVNEGNGRIFKVSPAGIVTTVVQFQDGTCAASLVEAPDGHLYGTTRNDIFRLTKSGVITALSGIDTLDHAPVGDLIVGTDGNVYGAYGPIRIGQAGFFFGFSPASGNRVFTMIRPGPGSGIVEGEPGVFYSTDQDNLIRFGPAEAGVTVVAELNRELVGARQVQMIRGQDGRLYGLSAEGTSSGLGGVMRGKGTAFALTVAGAATQLAGFDREGPLLVAGALIEGVDELIGTSCLGGPYDRGTVFSLGASGISLLHAFGAGDGACPTGIVQGADGSLFGITLDSTVFRLAPDGAFTVLHRVTGARRTVPDNLTLGSDGNLWGNWIDDGAVVFRITMAGEMSRFPLPAGSGTPAGGLVQASDGHFYGTAYNSEGLQTTVFRVTLGGQVTVVATSTDVRAMFGRLIQGADGNLYGSSLFGYDFGPPLTPEPGFVFGVSPGGTITTVHEFTALEGYSPLGELVKVANGEYVGVTPGRLNDPSRAGSIFAAGSSGSFRTLHAFGGSDGANPYAPLLRGSDGAVYGTTLFGGPWTAGVIFRIEP
jgi:uncharacterized repeat protein (TIGR03803 family)